MGSLHRLCRYIDAKVVDSVPEKVSRRCQPDLCNLKLFEYFIKTDSDGMMFLIGYLMPTHLQDVDRLGIGRVMELALKALGVSGKGDDGAEIPLHLSFDIDSVDPKV